MTVKEYEMQTLISARRQNCGRGWNSQLMWPVNSHLWPPVGGEEHGVSKTLHFRAKLEAIAYTYMYIIFVHKGGGQKNT